MKKNLVSIMLVAMVALGMFAMDFHVGIFNYKDILTDTRGKQYNVYEDKSGFKVLEPVQDKRSFVVKIIPINDYKNN